MSSGEGGGPAIPSLGAAHTDLSDYAGSTENREVIERRGRLLGSNLLFYHDPVHLVRGEGVHLYDASGRQYLDCYNNVPSVGHCNPKVVEALSRQASLLNTHTRYLHEAVLDYAEKLTSTLPDGLDMCVFVCTGTEANELAMRMSRAVSGKQGAVVMEYSYHGNSTLVAELSTIGSAPANRPAHVQAVEPPNSYRGPFREEGADLGRSYAELVDEAILELDERGEGTAAFLCDAIFDSQGGLEAPDGYFEHAYSKVRAAGGLCVADEVQAGFARTGKMWGFEHAGVVPDIVTFGKPAGNGHPLAGVVTSREILQQFSRSSIYFNTFGGNPVSAAVGLAVLQEIEDRGLVQQVDRVGSYMRGTLERLAERHEIIGNVRGRGLYQALELVVDRESREPAVEQARKIPDAMKEKGVLIGLSGRLGNVLKIRPPLVFEQPHVDQLIEVLDDVLLAL